MTKSELEGILGASIPKDLVVPFLSSYENALGQYRKENWQYFGNDVGQFIEIARRIVEYKLSGKYTLLTEQLSIFSEKVLTEYERFPKEISESYRIVIPRILYSMYCLRNKRGMIHKSSIDPNKMDASILLADAKWVLAEFFRLSSTLTFEETTAIIDSIINKEISLVWNAGENLRILNPKMATKDKVLCLLYAKNGQSEMELLNATEYSNKASFRTILRRLHKEKLIEYSSEHCILSPTGIDMAEKLLSQK